jgi:hypothetical protein
MSWDLISESQLYFIYARFKNKFSLDPFSKPGVKLKLKIITSIT